MEDIVPVKAKRMRITEAIAGKLFAFVYADRLCHGILRSCSGLSVKHTGDRRHHAR